MSKHKKGERHRAALYNRARLELAVLDHLDEHSPRNLTEPCRPVEIRTLAELFDMTMDDMDKLLDGFRLAGIVLYNPHAGTAALAPLPA